jgi:hypothetical protein
VCEEDLRSVEFWRAVVEKAASRHSSSSRSIYPGYFRFFQWNDEGKMIDRYKEGDQQAPPPALCCMVELVGSIYD